MSNVWKWILGILAVLVIVASIGAVVYVMRYQMPMVTSFRAAPNGNIPAQPQAPNAPGNQGQPNNPQFQNRPRGPMMQNGFGFNHHYPMQGFGWGMPMMGGRGFSRFGMMPFGWGFFLIGGLFRLIIPLGILVLVAVVFYQMGKRAGAAAATQPAAPAANPPADARPKPAGRKVAKR